MARLLWKTVWPFFQRLNSESADDPETPLLGPRPQLLGAGLGEVLAHAWPGLHDSQAPDRGSTCVCADGWISRTRPICTPERHSALRGKVALTHAGVWTTPKGGARSERIRHEECVRFHSRVATTTET